MIEQRGLSPSPLHSKAKRVREVPRVYNACRRNGSGENRVGERVRVVGTKRIYDPL